jgi:hypothetical protein
LYLDDNNLDGLKVESLPALRNLTTLSLVNCNLETLDFAVIPQKFPQLETLTLDDNLFNGTQQQSILSFFESNNIKSPGNPQMRTKNYYFKDLQDVQSVNWPTWLLGPAVVVLIFILLALVFYRICKKYCPFPPCAEPKVVQDIKPSTSMHDNIYEIVPDENQCPDDVIYMQMTA